MSAAAPSFQVMFSSRFYTADPAKSDTRTPRDESEVDGGAGGSSLLNCTAQPVHVKPQGRPQDYLASKEKVNHVDLQPETSELLHGAESPDTALSALQHFSTHSGGGANSPPQLNFAHYLFSRKPSSARFFSKPCTHARRLFFRISASLGPTPAKSLCSMVDILSN